MNDTELSTLPVFDREATMDRLDGDRDLFNELIKIFIEDSAAQLVKLKDALDSNSYGDSAKVAHGLKGALGNIGAMRAHRVALAIELKGKAGICDLTLFARLESEISAYLSAVRAL